MSIAPRKIGDYIPWAQSHGQTFVDNAAAIGVPSAVATAFQDAADQLSKTLAAQIAAQDAARAATEALEDEIRDNRRALADIVRMVRVKAAASGNPTAVFSAAGLPNPAVPTPVAPPGLPRDFTVGVNMSTGAIELKWKVTNPANGQGTVYLVQRKFSQTAAPQFCGIAGGEKAFTDATLPLGTDSVIYMVTGQRSGVAGQTAEVNVRFGTVGGNATATVFEAPGQAAGRRGGGGGRSGRS